MSPSCGDCQHGQIENGDYRCFWALSGTTRLPEWHWIKAPLIDPAGGADCRAYLPKLEDETHD
jgi:hypothetical protein